MALVTREVYQCGVCKWEWIPRKTKGEHPIRCPKKECRARNWNGKSLKIKRRALVRADAGGVGAGVVPGVKHDWGNCTKYGCLLCRELGVKSPRRGL